MPDHLANLAAYTALTLSLVNTAVLVGSAWFKRGRLTGTVKTAHLKPLSPGRYAYQIDLELAVHGRTVCIGETWLTFDYHASAEARHRKKITKPLKLPLTRALPYAAEDLLSGADVRLAPLLAGEIHEGIPLPGMILHSGERRIYTLIGALATDRLEVDPTGHAARGGWSIIIDCGASVTQVPFAFPATAVTGNTNGAEPPALAPLNLPVGFCAQRD